MKHDLELVFKFLGTYKSQGFVFLIYEKIRVHASKWTPAESDSIAKYLCPMACGTHKNEGEFKKKAASTMIAGTS